MVDVRPTPVTPWLLGFVPSKPQVASQQASMGGAHKWHSVISLEQWRQKACMHGERRPKYAIGKLHLRQKCVLTCRCWPDIAAISSQPVWSLLRHSGLSRSCPDSTPVKLIRAWTGGSLNPGQDRDVSYDLTAHLLTDDFVNAAVPLANRPSMRCLPLGWTWTVCRAEQKAHSASWKEQRLREVSSCTELLTIVKVV